MILDHPRDGNLPRVNVLAMTTIIGMMANDHPGDGGHPWVCLEDFDHFVEGDLPGDGDHPMKGGHHRDGVHPRDGDCLREFYHP